MNARFSELKNLNLYAADGPIGKVVDILVDDNLWIVRYLVVDLTGAEAKRVLISPAAISNVDLDDGIISTQLDSHRVESSPRLRRPTANLTPA